MRVRAIQDTSFSPFFPLSLSLSPSLPLSLSLSLFLVRRGGQNFFFSSAGARSRTHPLCSVTRDRLAGGPSTSGGEAASVYRSVCPSVFLSPARSALTRANAGSLTLSLVRSLARSFQLSSPSFPPFTVYLSRSLAHSDPPPSLAVPLSCSSFPIFLLSPLSSLSLSLFVLPARNPACSFALSLSPGLS